MSKWTIPDDELVLSASTTSSAVTDMKANTQIEPSNKQASSTMGVFGFNSKNAAMSDDSDNDSSFKCNSFINICVYINHFFV